MQGVPALKSQEIMALPGERVVDTKVVIVSTFMPLLMSLHAFATGAGIFSDGLFSCISAYTLLA